MDSCPPYTLHAPRLAPSNMATWIIGCLSVSCHCLGGAPGREVIERCMEQYHTHTKRLALPVDDHTLASAHEEGEQLMLACFDTQRFGHRVPAGQADEQMDVLHAALAKELAALQEKNRFESSIACEARYAQCAEDMDRLQAMTLPSIHRFDSHLRQCNNSFQAGCRGPAKETFLGRLDKVSTISFVRID
eukprot:jgi/Mesvir1/21917/Mv26560-RA.1